MLYASMKHRGGFKNRFHILLNINLKIAPVELLNYFQGVKEQNYKSSSSASFFQLKESYFYKFFFSNSVMWKL